MTRLRTINEAFNFLKAQDPGTSITPYALRCMVVNGVVPTIKAGKKYLLDIDALLQYLAGSIAPKISPEPPEIGTIRPISAHGKFA